MMKRSRMSALRRLIFTGILIAVLLVPLAPVQAGGPPGKSSPAPVSRFGVVEAYYRPGDASDLNVGWDRIIFEWPKFQPNGPDDFDTSAVSEAWLNDDRQAGREVIGLLKNTPPWASGSDKLGAPPKGLDLPIDDPGNYWAAFVQRTVRYYGERWGIKHWIIYNEPDLRPGEISWYEFDGGVVDYYRMLKVAYLAAKSANPDAVIHLAGMAWWTDKTSGRTPYLKRLLAVIALDPDAYSYHFYFDVVMVHVYFSTSSVWSMINEIQGILWSYELQDKPIWIDETNARPSRDPLVQLPPNLAYNITLDQQADFLVQAAALALAIGVERFAVYRLYDNHFTPGVTEPWGLVRGDGSRRPAFMAYRTIIQTFSNTVSAHWYYTENASLVTLEQSDKTVYVLWARKTKPVRFFIYSKTAGEPADRVNFYGPATPLQSASTPGFNEWWYVIDTPPAVPDDSGEIMVEGAPTIVIASGPARTVWIEVDGLYWQLR